MADKGGVYVLDEPTTGLHLADVEQLLGLLDRLVDSGKSVIVIEHHQAVMAHADWIIDLGPGAGHDGGRIVFEGTPADLVAARSTLTGEHLAAYVGPQPRPAAPPPPPAGSGRREGDVTGACLVPDRARPIPANRTFRSFGDETEISSPLGGMTSDRRPAGCRGLPISTIVNGCIVSATALIGGRRDGRDRSGGDGGCSEPGSVDVYVEHRGN